MRYLLIDRIIEWEKHRSIKGIKNIAMSEDFLEFHFPDRPVMPGVMLLESLTQLAGWLVALSSDFTKWVLINHVRQCKFYSFALPGDQVELTIETTEATKDGQCFKGIGTVEGKKKIVLDFQGEIIDLDLIEDIERKQKEFAILTRETPWR